MRYYIIDAQGNLITKEADLQVATAIAEEVGGEVVEM